MFPLKQQFLIVAIALSGLVFAQAAYALQLTNAVFQEIDVKGADGKTERKTVPAATIVPGTEVIYVISYKNDKANSADKVVITNPIPAELEYLSVIGPAPANQVSVDGSKNYGALASLAVTGADGKPRPAKAADVTHVRWDLGVALKPGDEGKVSFKARLK